MTIGERIKARRIELGMTQDELASKLQLKSKVSVSNVENNKEDLTTTRVAKYAKALECTPAYLMGWEDDILSAYKRNIKYGDILSNLKDEELDHIRKLRLLNEEGKEKVFSYTSDLVSTGRYQKKDNEIPMVD